MGLREWIEDIVGKVLRTTLEKERAAQEQRFEEIIRRVVKEENPVPSYGEGPVALRLEKTRASFGDHEGAQVERLADFFGYKPSKYFKETILRDGWLPLRCAEAYARYVGMRLVVVREHDGFGPRPGPEDSIEARGKSGKSKSP